MVEQLKMHVPAKGRPSKLSVEDQVLLYLSYWREYRTLFHVATSYRISEPTVSRIFRHVEDCLIKSNLFNLPKNLSEGGGIEWNFLIVDAIEIPIQRHKKQKKSYILNKKTHTFKVEAIIHYKTQQVLSLCKSNGALHHFELFKCNLQKIRSGAFILADKGYQGVYHVHPTRLLPLKAKRRCKLNPILKVYNQ